MAILLSTQSVAANERFAFWREAVCDSYVLLDCQSPDPARFHGEILLNRLSRLSTSFVSGSRQVVSRRKRDILKSEEGSFLISLQLATEGVISQCDRDAHLQPGDFALYSSVDRYRLNLKNGFRQLVVQIPRDEFLARLPQADLLTGITVSGKSVIGSVINDSVLRLVSSLDRTDEAVRQHLQDTIVDLFVTGLASLDQARYSLSRPEHQILLRAETIIRRHLQHPNFDREALSSAMGMSVRRLSEIFRNDDRSISQTIRDMRLARIAADLRDERFARQSIAEIGMRWGIDNPQSLIRNFKARFGATPRDYRSGISTRQ